ncbi:MAG: adenosine deaminase [Deltaproteobacteria bacterium]|nr:adenosine deaminase [Deltaproteobacteria bacterium]
MENQFIEALENRDLRALQSVPKSDLHNHSALGGRLEYIERILSVNIPRPGPHFKIFDGFTDWIDDHIVPLLEGTAGFEMATEAAFHQARSDGVVVLNMSIDSSWPSVLDCTVEKLISMIDRLHKQCAPGIDFQPELGFSRDRPVEELMERFEPFLDYDYLKSIDLYKNEFAQPIGNLKPIYRMAKEKGLALKAHVGEYGDAGSIREAVEELELDQVQHGISAADSPEIMKWLSDNRIQLNVCPTSNVMLCRVEHMKVHPIKALYDNGVKVTVNTDDVIVFNQGVSEEFMNLYKTGLFSALELDGIRLNGLDTGP